MKKFQDFSITINHFQMFAPFKILFFIMSIKPSSKPRVSYEKIKCVHYEFYSNLITLRIHDLTRKRKKIYILEKLCDRIIWLWKNIKK